VQLGSGTVNITNDVSHSGLVAQEGGQMGRLGGVILGEAANATLVMSTPLAGQKCQISVPGPLEFSVRHHYGCMF
jgi:hypothetical protein